jgi:hypothetical protein
LAGVTRGSFTHSRPLLPIIADHSQNIKEGIEGHPVSWYQEVFDLVFPDIDREQANNVWKTQLAKPPKEKGERTNEEEDE